VTSLLETERSPAPLFDPDRPRPRAHWAPGQLPELFGSLGASAAVVAVAFTVGGLFTLSIRTMLFGELVCVMIGFLLIFGILTALRHGPIVAKDRLATVGIWVGASIALFPLVQMVLSVIGHGGSVVFEHFPDFLTHDRVDNGMGNAIIGTFEQVGLATFYTVPISLLTATFLSETSSAFSRIVRTIVDAMMGTPSIIAGLFVYLIWVQPKGTNGYSGFAASLALAVLMLPLMIRTAEEVIRVVPGSLREAALALGAPRWKVSLRIVLPTVRSGLLTAMILGVALGVGETAPTLFTAHGSEVYNFNPFSGVQANLPLQAFQLIQSPSPDLVRQAWGGAFILVFMILGLFTATRILSRQRVGAPRRRFRRPRKEVELP